MVLLLFDTNGLNVEAVKETVKVLSTGTLDEKEKAAKALDRMLQMHEQQRATNAATVVKAGAILPCVVLLKDGTAAGQMHAAGILACAAETPSGIFGNPTAVAAAAANQVAIVKAGGIPPLVSLLRSGSANAQEMAAGAIAAVSEDATNQKALMKAGAILPLVQLLRGGSANAQVHAANSAAHLSANNPECQNALAQSGAVPMLIALLGSGKAQMPAAG